MDTRNSYDIYLLTEQIQCKFSTNDLMSVEENMKLLSLLNLGTRHYNLKTKICTYLVGTT